MALKQMEEIYDQRESGPMMKRFDKIRGTRVFGNTMGEDSACIAFLTMTKGTLSEDLITGKRRVDFYVDTEVQRDYLVNVWKLGMGPEPKSVKANIEFDKVEIDFLLITLDSLMEQVRRTMPDVSLPPVAQELQRKLNRFKKEMEK